MIQNKNGKRLGDRAIVVGGSMIGLLAARALSPRFDEVIVVERDHAPEGPFPRRGAPQGWHVHVMLDKGREIVQDYFPGIFDEMEAAGAVRADTAADLAWYHHGVWKLRKPNHMYFYLQSRPLVEWMVRKRLNQDCANVRILYEHDVMNLIVDAQRKNISGVTIRSHNPMREEQVHADLVVDASGRGSKFPRWLEDLGYQHPGEDRVRIDIGYTTRLYEQPAKSERDWAAMMIYPKSPDCRLGYIYHIEPGPEGRKRWIVTMTGYHGAHASMTEESYLEHAKSLARPDIYETIKKAKPITGFASYKMPASRRMRYDKCRLPNGFVAVGDALCSFNPIYGQGMSVGSMAVRALDRSLNRGLKNITKRFFRRASWTVSMIPWVLATAEDFRYKETEGKRPFYLPILHWYVGAVHKLSAQYSAVYDEFFRVLHFIHTPVGLFRPSVFFRILGYTFGLLRGPMPSPETQYRPLEPGEGVMEKLRESDKQRKRKRSGNRRTKSEAAA